MVNFIFNYLKKCEDNMSEFQVSIVRTLLISLIVGLKVSIKSIVRWLRVVFPQVLELNIKTIVWNLICFKFQQSHFLSDLCFVFFDYFQWREHGGFPEDFP